MKFSAQEEYGLRCLIQIARLGPEGSMTIPEISRQEGLSQTHVAKLLMILRKDGFLSATRGQQGGYALSRSPEQIRIGDVLAALGGRLYDDEFCGRHSGLQDVCAHSVDCSVKALWSEIQTVVDSVVNRITLADLLVEKEPVPNVTFFADLSERPKSTPVEA